MKAFLKYQFLVRPDGRRTFKLAGFLAICAGCAVLWSLAIQRNWLMAEIGHANLPEPVAVATTNPEAK